MRGQFLFVRPIEAADSEAIATFLTRNGAEPRSPACGLLGKIVGDLVAVVEIEILPDGLRILDLVVGREMRRKRIGRRMLEEAALLAGKLNRDRLIVEAPGAAIGFLKRSGFLEEGNRVVRRIG